MAETKKNPDYSASAVNLTNDNSVKSVLLYLRNWQCVLNDLKAQSEALIPSELKERIKEAEKNVTTAGQDIRVAIDERGSYQDIEAGQYAVKQRRESTTYLPEKVEDYLANFASAVIEKSVNKKALEGLIKGNLITAEQARMCGVVSMSYAYIIKV